MIGGTVSCDLHSGQQHLHHICNQCTVHAIHTLNEGMLFVYCEVFSAASADPHVLGIKGDGRRLYIRP